MNIRSAMMLLLLLGQPAFAESAPPPRRPVAAAPTLASLDGIWVEGANCDIGSDLRLVIDNSPVNPATKRTIAVLHQYETWCNIESARRSGRTLHLTAQCSDLDEPPGEQRFEIRRVNAAAIEINGAPYKFCGRQRP